MGVPTAGNELFLLLVFLQFLCSPLRSLRFVVPWNQCAESDAQHLTSEPQRTQRGAGGPQLMGLPNAGNELSCWSYFAR